MKPAQALTRPEEPRLYSSQHQARTFWQWLNYLETRLLAGKRVVYISMTRRPSPMHYQGLRGTCARLKGHLTHRVAFLERIHAKNNRGTDMHIASISSDPSLQAFLPPVHLSKISPFSLRVLRESASKWLRTSTFGANTLRGSRTASSASILSLSRGSPPPQSTRCAAGAPGRLLSSTYTHQHHPPGDIERLLHGIRTCARHVHAASSGRICLSKLQSTIASRVREHAAPPRRRLHKRR